MFRQIGPGEIVVIVVVLVLLFGSRKLPELARSIGKAARELRKGMREDDDEGPGGDMGPTDSGTPPGDRG